MQPSVVASVPTEITGSGPGPFKRKSFHRHTWRDYAFLAILFAAVLAILAIPVIVLVLILLWIAHRL